MDEELKNYLEQMEARIEARAEKREIRMNERIDGLDSRMERVETEGRQTRVLLEGMHDNIRVLGEGVMGVTERLEAFQREMAENLGDLKATLSPVFQSLSGRVQSMDEHIQFLDTRVRSVDGRVRILEAKADRQTEDVLDSIRKKFGKPQA